MTETPALYADRLNALREKLKSQTLDGFLVPMADEYQNEYVSAHDKRIEFLSGFSGSSAFVIILNDRALFFTDSRYTLQAKQQLPDDLYTIHDVAEMMPSKWINKNVPEHARLGFDPRLHTAKQIERLEVIAFKRHISLIPLTSNPIDELWHEQPEKPAAPILLHEEHFAGESSSDKRRKICETLRSKNTDAVVITDPASVAWLLNIRGSDVPHTPLPLSTLIMHNDETVEWFVDPRKTSDELDASLDTHIKRDKAESFEPALKALGEKQANVQIDLNLTSFFVANTLRKAGAKLVPAEDPCTLPRACKNKTEIKGMVAAHERDGVALVRFLSWIDAQVKAGNAITEIEADKTLTAFRAENDHYRGLSFSTIAGSGPNGAIVHYCATEETNRTLQKGEFFLVDSGAQYLDGTTDVTRTIPIGDVSDEMKDRYTRVLKGHIALAKARFPSGINGANLDSLARQYLWDIGLDFGHGTGHGVGSYLCVHEGPQNISRRSETALRPGMVLSNEPGYYKEGAYGIRHENLQYVVELNHLEGNGLSMLGFRPLTLAPFDTRAVLANMLTNEERAWLNEYHAYTYETLAPHLDEDTRAWLQNATKEV